MTIPPRERPDGASASEAWLSPYRRARTPGSYDEVLDAGGAPRLAWQKLVAAFGGMGEAEIGRRWEQAQRLLHEHGVSYDAYGDPQGVSRPWNLAPIPVVIGADEWSDVGRGLRQRALLLDGILADLYGARRLLTTGSVPPEIVFSHPGFVRACSGIVPPGGRFLPLYAADLARMPSGAFAVMADRTQAPSGAGYALENRVVLSRSLPDVFRECNVQRLAVFFRTMRDTLRQLAPYNRDNPRIVLLTPGPYNATYFEQAFLSQYLGLTLVEGGDLTVRDHRVFLKTLGGLQAVDVILRRVNDTFCDPLELNPESALGIPGLVEAARSGNVALANPLGAGLVQSSAFIPFLPRLCRELLGEELLLPSVPTHWCGDATSLRYVIDHLAELVIRSALPDASMEPIFGRDLGAAGLDELRARIRHAPRKYVAQEAVVLSTVPTLAGEGLYAAHLWMRAYLVSSGDSYEVMPGALSRVGGPGESLGLSLQPGGKSKDTWVLSGGPVNTFSLLPPPRASIALSRGGGDLPSRVADNLFWLGRYVERAEGIARLTRSIGSRLAELNGAGDAEPPVELDALFAVLETETQVPRPKFGTDPAIDSRGRTSWAVAAEQSLLASVFDSESLETLKTTIEASYRVARTVRDRISQDTWRTIAQLDRDVRGALGLSGPRTLVALTHLLNGIVTALAAFSGLAMDSMTRGQAWRFLDMGRRLERGTHMTALLQGALATPSPREAPLLEALLDVADSSMTYRRRYLATLQFAPVIDLLLTDESNPRSVLFQASALADHIEVLPREPGLPMSAQLKMVLTSASELRLAEVAEISEPDEHGQRPRLSALLEHQAALFAALSHSISGAYLNHAIMSRQLDSGGA
ncbi:MAG TPA: circularly permuted type 2 ATP-grasp protein [Polyangiaceae bacterium]|nr:circularly permuted type 2 ATP-grasp protein [Polyangiaceae bacterium]